MGEVCLGSILVEIGNQSPFTREDTGQATVRGILP
jgi:hypothetical protein